MVQSIETIKSSHTLDGDVGKLRDYYADWANKYDSDVASEGYGGPAVIASAAVTAALGYLRRPPSTIQVLDAGCGTGLAGIELRQLGFKTVDGFDLSGEMTDIASKTGAYDRLEPDVDLNVDHPNRLGREYDLMICCGVLTLGHVAPDALLRLAAYMKEGGVMIISTRNSYLEGSDYGEVSEGYVRDGHLESLGHLKDAHYIEEEGAHYWLYRKPVTKA